MVRAKLRQETAYWQVSMSEKQYHTQLNGCLYKYCGLLSLFYSHIISYPRTGSTGHSDIFVVLAELTAIMVSIPNGLPRPFRLTRTLGRQVINFSFNPEREGSK